MDCRKDMQAGFTVLPSGGVRLSLQRRRWSTTKKGGLSEEEVVFQVL